MGLVDTHTHLESFVRNGTLEPALQRARAAAVNALISIGTSPEDWSMYRELTDAYPGFVHYTVGLHPCSVDERWEKAIGQMGAFWREEGRPVALGECGLDRFHLPKEAAAAERILGWQRDAFSAQLDLAKQLECPIVVHSRGAFQECVELIDASRVDWKKVVFHCFTEGEPEMRLLMSRGGCGSFTGILTYKNADAVRAAAKVQGLDRCMIETDAPYLAPMPHRGKSNEPAFVRHTAEFAAEQVFHVSYDDLAAATTAIARKFFGLSPKEPM
jgi:TatD DNase family protein